jgi:hypothetical protein
MDRVTHGRVLLAALCCLAVLHADAAAAALPEAGARFAARDHRTKGAGWHVEVEVSKRDPAVLRTVVVYDERCDETVAAERVRLTPDGVLDAGASFVATGAGGREHAAMWEVDARFATPQKLEGSFRIVEPGCEASRSFTAVTGEPHRHLTELGYPDLAAATPQARREARRMLRRVRAVAARRFPTIEHARAEGFNRYKFPSPPGPGLFHLWSLEHNIDDGILDPERVESLVYWNPVDRRAAPVLVGFMFRAGPGPRPRFAGNIPVWHTHQQGGDKMIHIWLTPDLRAAYANCRPVRELERALHPFRFDDGPSHHHEAQPCPE